MRRLKYNCSNLNKTQLWFFILLCAAIHANARGNQETITQEVQHGEFILCITAFDVSALPPGQRILGPILQRDLIHELGRIHHRLRGENELERYEELAYLAELHQAASHLAAKRAERDVLLFQGVPDWKYRRELRRIDREIIDLEAAYRKAEEEIPLIEPKPLFRIAPVNTGLETTGTNGTFPPPPPQGGEEFFLRTYNTDAFLEGTLRLVYGRIYAEFRIYTWGASYIYNDSTIFSLEDLTAVSDELKSRFLTAISNSEPAGLALHVSPDHTLLELNGRYAVSGETHILPPGPVFVRASAENYHGETLELELEGGITEEHSIELSPLAVGRISIAFPGPNSSIYLGAQFLGSNQINEMDEDEMDEDEMEEAAEENTGFFSVYIPAGQYSYIRIDTEDGLGAEAIVLGEHDDPPTDDVRIVTLEPRILPGRDDKPVDDMRRKFYSAFGRFWVALPLTFFINGMYHTYYNSYYIGATTQGNADMYETARNMYYVSMGAWVVTGAFLAESLLRMVLYINTANRESILVWE